MNLASRIARILLGLLFTVFGLNGYLHFIPMGPLPTGLAGAYIGALFQSHYLAVVFLFQLIPGLLLLVNRYVPLALALLAPVIVNILLYHVFLNPTGLPMAGLAAILWLLAAWNVRSAFAGLVQQPARS